MGHDLYWGMPVILYLFMGGVGAGAVIISGHVYHLAGAGSFGFRVARYGALIAPLPVMLGTGLIIWELGRMYRVANLFKVVNLSPMNIGSWLLFFFIILTTVYAISFLPWLSKPGDKWEPVRKTLAWACVPVGYGVAVYTGIMLGATPGRPFWNSSVLPFLFLLSALSGGIASIVLASALLHKPGSAKEEREFHEGSFLLVSWDTLLIALELVSLFVFVIFAYLTVESARAAISLILADGALVVEFWGGVVMVALVIPLLAYLPLVAPTLMYGRPFKAHKAVEIFVPLCILTGGFILRYLVVVAGQVSHPVGI